MQVELELTPEQEDRIILESLKISRSILRDELICDKTNDTEADLAAFRRVIAYYESP